MRPDSVAVAFGYDSAGRPSTVRFDRGTLRFGYSSTTGHLGAIRAPSGDSLTFTYDGPLATAVRWKGAVNGSVEVGYNPDFQVASQSVNGADQVDFAYDHDGLLTSAGALTLTRNVTNGLLESDALGSIASAYRHTFHGELAGFGVTANGTTLFGTGYERDSLGRITQLDDTAEGTPTHWRFAYDSIGRLVADSVNGLPFHAFSYDANGNRLSYTSSNGTVTYSYDAQDRLLSAGTTSYTYGSNGDLRTRTIPGVGTTTYTYDALGNLITVVLPDGTQIDYVIDGQNRRIGRKVNGVLVQGWLYQNEVTLAAELDRNGDVVGRFVYGSRANVPDYMVKGDTTYRIISDHLGSVRLVLNTMTGAIVQRIDYDEWGNVTEETNSGFQPFGFAGGLYDVQTGLVRFGSRDYASLVGRWTAKDPIRFLGGDASLYGYAANDPINRMDPLGRNAGCPAQKKPSFLECAASAASFGANVVMSGLVILGAAEIAAGILGAEATGMTAAVVGGDAGAGLDLAASLIEQGARHVGQGALPSLLTAIGVGGDMASGNFSWLNSLVPIVGLPSAYDAVAANCPELW